MGDKAEMKTGGSRPSKHLSPAINHTHAKVRATQEFPDMEKKVMKGIQMLSAVV